MKKTKITILLFLMMLITAHFSSAQNQSNTYPETRELLLEMQRSHADEALIKLFEEGDLRQADLIEALYDNERKVSLNAQSVIKYLAEPKALDALDKWYEFRKAQKNEYWISPVTMLTEVKYLSGNKKDLVKLVLENLYPEQKDVSGELIAYNKRNNTALIEVIFGHTFTDGRHIVIKQEDSKWRLLSNYLVWQS